jgi:hypothetical protein
VSSSIQIDDSSRPRLHHYLEDANKASRSGGGHDRD